MRPLLIAFLLCALSAHGQVRWLDTRHNFGAFDEDTGPVECSFRWVNEADEPVSIVSARTSCGCTAPRYDRHSIAPGDTGSITVVYDPAGRPGRFSKYVQVEFSQEVPKVKLEIFGTVVGSARSVKQRFPVSCGNTGMQLAKGVVMLGEVGHGRLKPVYLEAYNRTTDTITPRFGNLPKYLEVVPTPQRIAPGEQASFIFYMHSAKCPLYGMVTDTLTLSTAEHPDLCCELPTVAIVREDFSKLTDKERRNAPLLVVPQSSADFGKITADEEVRELEIRNSGKSPLLIRRIYTADPGISVSVSSDKIKPGKSATIRITVRKALLPGALLNARISLITNDPDNSNTIIRAVGTL